LEEHFATKHNNEQQLCQFKMEQDLFKLEDNYKLGRPIYNEQFIDSLYKRLREARKQVAKLKDEIDLIYQSHVIDI
jgi:hypothetical protein